jgi:signal transduction histidine kinase
VDDEGTGIPEEDRAKVFQAFYSTKESGSGLGLPIASQIVTQHQGKIHCRPRGERGTRFTVELPLLPETGGKSR